MTMVGMKLRITVLLATVVMAVVAIPASAEAAYPSCTVAWGALNGGYGSDNDMATQYGSAKRTYIDCGHGGGSTYTYTTVRVVFSSSSRCDTWVSYYSSAWSIWDRLYLTGSPGDVC